VQDEDPPLLHLLPDLRSDFLLHGFDVIGYSGGDVLIYCTIPKDRGYNMYFCKDSRTECVYPESDSSPNTWDHKGRVSVVEIPGFLTVIYRDLSSEDTGLYLCGETGDWSDTVNLNVKTGQNNLINTVTCNLGETVTISCSYPEEFKEKSKFISRLNGLDFTEIAHTSDPSTGRFSISEDRMSRVVSMRISDVREGDEGVYYCGVLGDRGAVSYDIFFTKIYLQITVSYHYPEEFNEKAKSFSTLNGLDFTEIAHTSDPSRGRFSISEDRMSRVVSMRISDVRKGDEGVFYCGVSGDRSAVSYDTFFTKIHLQVTGPVSCFDVIGYSGGNVIIYCTIPKDRGYNMYFCKDSRTECVYPESDSSSNTWDHKGRVSVDEISGFLTVFYRDLSSEDTGLYLCGGTGAWSNTVNLNILIFYKCCSGLKTVTGHPGKNVTISCSYPEEFKEKSKFISRLNGLDFTEMAHTSDPLRGRFSISEDRRSRVVSMRISDVRKSDGGDYYCGVLGDRSAVSYDTFFTKIYLQVTGEIYLSQ
uniref:Ig-like domain-containing protein n=1 Tax=Astyanax mexicanus TaxID=7994 RepID=A0A8B9HU80_ASTMX